MIKSSIYIHIPFCARKCGYCDFLSAEAGQETQQDYIQALLKEIREGASRFDKYRIHTVFIGGGTPSLLPSKELVRIMECVREAYHVEENAEISMEMNPGTVDARKLLDYYAAGINRISIGLQSCLDEELRCLGRIHTYAQFQEHFWTAREIGFTNINIDLMSALPGQTLRDYEYSLQQVCGLYPEHISAYSLIIEEGTPFYERYRNGELLPDEDTDRRMYERTKEVLSAHGLERYEISNYALPGHWCRHNVTYWQRGNYIGLGLGASSLLENVRWKNTSDMGTYLQGNVREEVCCLSVKEQMEEFMFLGLRMTKGVVCTEFRRQFGTEIRQVYGKQLEKLWEEQLIIVKKDHICLTERGLDLSNYVFGYFLLEDSFSACL